MMEHYVGEALSFIVMHFLDIFFQYRELFCGPFCSLFWESLILREVSREVTPLYQSVGSVLY